MMIIVVGQPVTLVYVMLQKKGEEIITMMLIFANMIY